MERAEDLKAAEDKLAAIGIDMQILVQALTVTLAEADARIEQTHSNVDWDDRDTIEADRVAIDERSMASKHTEPSDRSR